MRNLVSVRKKAEQVLHGHAGSVRNGPARAHDGPQNAAARARDECAAKHAGVEHRKCRSGRSPQT